MPKLPPSWRKRLKSPAPFATSVAGSERSVAAESGTKSRPLAAPRSAWATRTSFQPDSRVSRLMKPRVKSMRTMPTMKGLRGPMYQIRLPRKPITIAVEMLEGSDDRPDCQAVQPSSDWVYTGKRKMTP